MELGRETYTESSKIKPIIIWGASGHAIIVSDIVRESSQFRVVAFLDSVNPDRDGEVFDGCAIVAGSFSLAQLLSDHASAIAIAVGNNRARIRLGAEAEVAGFYLPSLVHPRAIVSSTAVLGPGSIVAAGAIVNPRVDVGRLAVVNTGAGVDHECVLEDGSMVAPGARLAGRVRVKAGAWVGLGAMILQDCVIGEGSVVGAGAVVLHDVPPRTVVFGAPARVVREVKENDYT